MKDEPLSKNRAKAKLNRCLEEGAVIYSQHFRNELTNDDLITEDILAVCRSGAIIMVPERHQDRVVEVQDRRGPPIVVNYRWFSPLNLS
ncbi:MAG: hypothetical protein ACR2NN_13560 [Bryobacteraceae bacterium]